jgi:hypothetical protein
MFSKVSLLVIKRVLEVMKMSGSVVGEAGDLRKTRFSVDAENNFVSIGTTDTELMERVKELSQTERVLFYSTYK